MNKTIKSYSNIAYEILNNNTRYKSNKEIISSLFIDNVKKGNVETVMSRLNGY